MELMQIGMVCMTLSTRRQALPGSTGKAKAGASSAAAAARVVTLSLCIDCMTQATCSCSSAQRPVICSPLLSFTPDAVQAY